MDFELSEEHRMLKELVARFVADALLPLESKVLERESRGEGLGLTEAERKPVDAKARELGLWGLDAPTEFGGSDLPVEAMVGVHEELGKTITPYTFPPDSPNLRMLMVAANEEQRQTYLGPYARGETISAIGISEPGPARIRPRWRPARFAMATNGSSTGARSGSAAPRTPTSPS